MKNEKLILHLNEVNLSNIDIAGGKNASLGEMIQSLNSLGVQIPSGFIVTVNAYKEFISYNNLQSSINSLLKEIVPENIQSAAELGQKIRSLILSAEFPQSHKKAIESSYRELSDLYQTSNVDVAVRSSATAEDLPDASFAGQQETFLNVSGLDSLLSCIKECFASLFTDRAISYRAAFDFDHFDIGISVCIQKMVRSDLACSGVAFSLDTESGFKDVILINGSWGLGELIVQGAVCPDEFVLFKPALREGYPAIIEKQLGLKDRKMIYSSKAGERVETIATSKNEQNSFCLNNEQVLQLAEWILLIEKHYSDRKGSWCPMDIEWAIDGLSNQLFILQARPETVQSRKNLENLVSYSLEEPFDPGKVILKGIAVGDKVAAGTVRIVHSFDKSGTEHLNFNRGDVLVTDMTDPDWEPLMKIASAIITNKGGRTCHAAIVARELGVPAVVACQTATELLKDGEVVTVSCADGSIGTVYQGNLPFLKTEISLSTLPKPSIPIMLNVASPEKAFHYSHLPHAGVGLAREEFIINNYIKVHPLALLAHEKLEDVQLKEQISNITRGYENGADFFVEKLSHGIAKIAAAFYPKQVIVRFSDFKSNEYSNLLGGKTFEPLEENPMIGWRGASRYYSEKYKEAFGLECQAIRQVREKFGLLNVTVMIPFCRTVNELIRVYRVMEEYGLKRGKDGLKVYLMAEIPSNVIMADAFADYVDGFSIGSNDLTQLVLGLDRDSALVAELYDERNLAVKSMIKSLIETGKRKAVKVGICGQGPSDFPDFAQFLVEAGIDSVSVTPDSLVKTLKALAAIEQKTETVLT